MITLLSAFSLWSWLSLLKVLLPCFTGKSVVSQLRIEPTFITLTFVIFMAASLVPLARNVDPEESEGIFTPKAEIINGRAAMLGFASLLIIEAVKGTALFGQ